MIKSASFVKVSLLIVSISILTYLLLTRLVFTEPIFAYNEDDRYERVKSYYEDRRERNALSISVSFAELEAVADYHLQHENWKDALTHLKNAKSLRPDDISVRKNLCYIYLQLCSKDWRYCKYAQREVYYAHKYIPQGDVHSKQYITQLSKIVEVEEIVQMSEREAMAAIF